MTKMQLEPEFRSKWLEALRSPEWEGREAYGALHGGQGTYCALGLGLCANGFDPDPAEPYVDPYAPLEAVGVDPFRVWRTFDPGGNMTFKQFADWLEANSEPAA